MYLGKSGCVKWDFNDGQFAYHSIHGTNCSYICETDYEDEDFNCTIIDTRPNENNNQIKLRYVQYLMDIKKMF